MLTELRRISIAMTGVLRTFEYFYSKISKIPLYLLTFQTYASPTLIVVAFMNEYALFWIVKHVDLAVAHAHHNKEWNSAIQRFWLKLVKTHHKSSHESVGHSPPTRLLRFMFRCSSSLIPVTQQHISTCL